MKFNFILAATIVLLSSCLKQSIPDAMLAAKDAGTGAGASTLSYELNGNPVRITVAGKQDPNSYKLGCEKATGYYVLSGLSDAGETTFLFYTDSLTIGKYMYTGSYGDMFFISYNGQNEYAHAASDNLTFNITSYENGLISGDFSGKLSPMISSGNPSNIYGTAGSVSITNGTFQHVPVFY